MSTQLILNDIRGTTAIITLNRPERRNALSRGLIEELSDAIERAGRDSDVRSVVLTGAGSAFCAGMDLKESASKTASISHSEETLMVANAQAIADLIDLVHKLPKPTIAALNGDAYAGGAGLALACDFVIASDGAKLGYPEVRRGLVASIVLHDLIRQAGDRRARRLLLGGTPISAHEAYAWGLYHEITSVDLLLERALELGRSLAECGPRALATTKRLLDESLFRPATLRGAAAISAAVRVSDEAIEGIAAFLEKRPPNWIPQGNRGSET